MPIINNTKITDYKKMYMKYFYGNKADSVYKKILDDNVDEQLISVCVQNDILELKNMTGMFVYRITAKGKAKFEELLKL